MRRPRPAAARTPIRGATTAVLIRGGTLPDKRSTVLPSPSRPEPPVTVRARDARLAYGIVQPPVSQTTTCLVTGGAGFLGINLVRHLLARRYAVASLDLADFDYPERDRVRIVRGDIRDRAVVGRALDGAQLVVHCAAALPRHPPAEIYSTDIDGTRTVIDAAHRKQTARFIQISSTAVYGIP